MKDVKILVVDDMRAIREVIIMVLRKEHPNAVFVSANSPESALEAVKTQSIDLVLTDIRMPPSKMNGYHSSSKNS